MVRLLPTTPAALVKVWGMGPKRLASHGALMLAALDPLRRPLISAPRARLPSSALSSLSFLLSFLSPLLSTLFSRWRATWGISRAIQSV